MISFEVIDLRSSRFSMLYSCAQRSILMFLYRVFNLFCSSFLKKILKIKKNYGYKLLYNIVRLRIYFIKSLF